MDAKPPGMPSLPPGINFSQIPESLRNFFFQQARQTMDQQIPIPQPQQLQHQLAQQLTQQQRKTKRQATKMQQSKRSKDSSTPSASDFSDYDTSSPPMITDTPRRSTRARSTRTSYADGESGSDAENSQETQEKKEKTEGPHIDKVYARSVGGNSQFLCSMPNKAWLHSIYLTESDLKSGTKGDSPLTEFQKNLELDGTSYSNISPQLVEPTTMKVPVECFCVDRIISHREIGEKETFPPEILDDSHYTPGYPTNSMPNLSNIMPYEAPLLSPAENVANCFVPETGIINFRYGFSKAEKLEEEEEEKEPQILERPKSVEFRIKWRGLHENQSTWENPDTLSGKENEPFSIANLPELSRLIDIYWMNALEKPRFSTAPMPLITDFPLMERDIELTEQQKIILNQLITSKNSNSPTVCLSTPGTGRIGAVCSFFHIARRKMNQKTKAIIIAENHQISKWINAVKMMTTLYYTEYNSDVDSRLVVRQEEITTSRADILIMSFDVFAKEADSLSALKWNYLVIDTLSKPEVSRFGGALKIYLENRTDLTPDFTYTERAIFVPNAISRLIHERISKLFKMRNNRVDPDSLMYEEVLSYHIHPFLITLMQQAVIKKYKMDNNIQTLTPDLQFSILLSASGKATRLPQLISPSGITIIISESYAAMRLLMHYFNQNQKNTAILNSPNKREAFPHTFNEGILFMTRDITSPVLINLKPATIIFYDIGKSRETDVSIVRYFKRNNDQLQVYRLVTDDSLEAVQYARYVTDPLFDYSRADSTEIKSFLRLEAFTTQSSHEPQIHEPMEVNMPGDPKPGTIFNVLFEQSAQNPNIFDVALSHSRMSQTRNEWKKQDAQTYLDYFAKFGFGEFEKIGQILNRPPDEIRDFARALFLYYLSDSERQTIVLHNLANAILWYEFFNAPFDDQFEENPDFWQQVKAEEPMLREALFLKRVFLSKIMQKRETILTRIETTWLIQAFLSLHKEPYLPPHYIGTSESFEESSASFFKLLRCFLECGDDSQEIQRQFPQFSFGENFPKFYIQIINTIKVDIMSIILHAIQSGQTDEFKSDKLLRPILLQLQKGPFSTFWNQDEVICVIQTAMEYHVPRMNGEKDFAEFHAIARLTAKPTKEVEAFFHDMEQEMLKPRKIDEPVIIPPRIMRIPEHFHQLTQFPKGAGDKYKSVISIISHIRALATNGITTFVPTKDLPKDWDITCDLALVTGAIQYGYGALSSDKLYRAAYHSGTTYHDIPMTRSLAQFSSFLSQKKNSNHRLTSIILWNRPIERRIKFWNEGIRHIEFHIPEKRTIPPQLQMRQNQIQAQQMQQQHANQSSKQKAQMSQGSMMSIPKVSQQKHQYQQMPIPPPNSNVNPNLNPPPGPFIPIQKGNKTATLSSTPITQSQQKQSSYQPPKSQSPYQQPQMPQNPLQQPIQQQQGMMQSQVPLQPQGTMQSYRMSMSQQQQVPNIPIPPPPQQQQQQQSQQQQSIFGINLESLQEIFGTKLTNSKPPPPPQQQQPTRPMNTQPIPPPPPPPQPSSQSLFPPNMQQVMQQTNSFVAVPPPQIPAQSMFASEFVAQSMFDSQTQQLMKPPAPQQSQTPQMAQMQAQLMNPQFYRQFSQPPPKFSQQQYPQFPNPSMIPPPPPPSSMMQLPTPPAPEKKPRKESKRAQAPISRKISFLEPKLPKKLIFLP